MALRLGDILIEQGVIDQEKLNAALSDQRAFGDTTIASGIQAVAGIGPTTFRSGIPQYLIGDDQPMQIPLIKPPITPSV